MTTVSVTIREQLFIGDASDMDALFFAGLLMPDYLNVVKREQGLSEAFQKFSVEHAATLAMTSEEEKDRAVAKLSETWSERVLIRLTNNLETRAAFAQRVREIFPDLPTTWVNYDSWKDAQGNTHEKCSIRLDVAEIMGIITPVTNTLNEQNTEATPSKSAALTIIPTPIPEPDAELENLKKIEELKHQLAIAQAQIPRPPAEGFGQVG